MKISEDKMIIVPLQTTRGSVERADEVKFLEDSYKKYMPKHLHFKTFVSEEVEGHDLFWTILYTDLLDEDEYNFLDQNFWNKEKIKA